MSVRWAATLWVASLGALFFSLSAFAVRSGYFVLFGIIAEGSLLYYLFGRSDARTRRTLSFTYVVVLAELGLYFLTHSPIDPTLHWLVAVVLILAPVLLGIGGAFITRRWWLGLGVLFVASPLFVWMEVLDAHRSFYYTPETALRGMTELMGRMGFAEWFRHFVTPEMVAPLLMLGSSALLMAVSAAITCAVRGNRRSCQDDN